MNELEKDDIRELLIRKEKALELALEDFDNNSYIVDRFLLKDREVQVAIEGINLIDKYIGGPLGRFLAKSSFEIDAKNLNMLSGNANKVIQAEYKDIKKRLSDSVKNIAPKETYLLKSTTLYKPYDSKVTSIIKFIKENNKFVKDGALYMNKAVNLYNELEKTQEELWNNSSYDKEDYIPRVKDISVRVEKLLRSLYKDIRKSEEGVYEGVTDKNIFPKPGMTINYNGNTTMMNFYNSDYTGQVIDTEIKGNDLIDLSRAILQSTVLEDISNTANKIFDLEKIYHKRMTEHILTSPPRMFKLGIFYSLIRRSQSFIVPGVSMHLSSSFRTEKKLAEDILKIIEKR